MLSAKPEERDLWQENYCAEDRARVDDFRAGRRGHCFNFLEYEYARGGLGAGLTSNVAELFARRLLEMNRSGKGGSNEAYWQNAIETDAPSSAIDLLAQWRRGPFRCR